MNEDIKQWIEANLSKLRGNTSWSKEELQMLFNIYSLLDNKEHRPTGCGRCVLTAKAFILKKYNDLK